MSVKLLDYIRSFERICNGLGIIPNDKIIQHCYQETNQYMTSEILQAATEQLNRNSRTHPKFADFFDAIVGAGYHKHQANQDYVLDGCTFSPKLCNGSGILVVQKVENGHEAEYLYRCFCSVGMSHRSHYGKDRQGNDLIIPVWNSLMEKQGYSIRNKG